MPAPKKSATASASREQVQRAVRRKIPRRFAPFVFALYMSAIMALLMCCVIVGVSTGVGDGYPRRVLATYELAMPAAFFCVLLVRPVVLRMVAATVHS